MRIHNKLRACDCRIFEQLGAVDELVLRGNALTELPPSTWRLASLRALDLSDNRLTALPPDVAGLENLQAGSSTVSESSPNHI